MRLKRVLRQMGLVAASGVAAALNMGGCGTPSVWEIITDTSVLAQGIPNDTPITCPVRVYLLRGLWDVYSIGLDSLADEMRTAIGVDATPITGADWQTYIAPIVEEYQNAGPDFELVLIGHSYGSDNVLQLAGGLAQEGVPVKLALLFDSTKPPAVPANVERAMHLYIPTRLGAGAPSLFAGNPIVPEPGNNSTIIENIVVNEENFGAGADVANHFQLESNPVLHVYAIDVVGQLCR